MLILDDKKFVRGATPPQVETRYVDKRKDISDQMQELEKRGGFENIPPDYLTGNQNFNAFLQSAVFYPLAGEDIRPIRHLEGLVSNFIYTGIAWEDPLNINAFLRSVAPERSRICISRFPPKNLFGMTWEELDQKYVDIEDLAHKTVSRDMISVVSYRREGRHQQELNIVYIPFEQTVVFRELYSGRNIFPKVLTYLNDALFTLLPEMMENKAGSPEFVLAGDGCGDDFHELNEGPLEMKYNLCWTFKSQDDRQLDLYRRT